MMILLPLLAALILGLVGGLAGSLWIRHLYRQQPSVLSFPEQQTVRSRFRPSGLASILTILFCWIMLTIGERGLQLSICLLLFDYSRLVLQCQFNLSQTEALANQLALRRVVIRQCQR